MKIQKNTKKTIEIPLIYAIASLRKKVNFPCRNIILECLCTLYSENSVIYLVDMKNSPVGRLTFKWKDIKVILGDESLELIMKVNIHIEESPGVITLTKVKVDIQPGILRHKQNAMEFFVDNIYESTLMDLYRLIAKLDVRHILDTLVEDNTKPADKFIQMIRKAHILEDHCSTFYSYLDSLDKMHDKFDDLVDIGSFMDKRLIDFLTDLYAIIGRESVVSKGRVFRHKGFYLIYAAHPKYDYIRVESDHPVFKEFLLIEKLSC